MATKTKKLKVYVFRFPNFYNIIAWEAYSWKEAKGLARYWYGQCKKLPNGTKCWVKDQTKHYNIKKNVGKVKYLISFHNGKKMHKDGSQFFDIRCFSNKKQANAFEKDLIQKGYIQILENK